MNIETKFNVGEKVYCAFPRETVRMTRLCPACNGEQVIRVNGYPFECRSCSDGYQHSNLERCIPHLLTVDGVWVSVESKGNTPIINYYFKNRPGPYSESILFSTKEECAAYCENNNNLYKRMLAEGWEEIKRPE